MASPRVKKVPGSTTTVYIFSGSKVIAEYDNGAAVTAPTREYIYSGSALIATIASTTTTYHHPDHLSVRMTTDTAGNVLAQQAHYPFGESWYASGTTTKWQFTSYERDAESGNDYAMFRSYVSRLGRFSSPDPIAGSIFDPQSLNRYAYVFNDPVNLTDPLGLFGARPQFDLPPVSHYGSGFFGPLGGAPDFRGWVGGPGSVLECFSWWWATACWWVNGDRRGNLGGDPAGGAGGDKKKRDVINAALKQDNLAKCLNKFFGPGTILTNDNLPRIDASRDLPGAQAGRTDPNQVPETGRGTVQIDKGIFTSLSANDPFLVGTYLHETANVLAIQRFTDVQPRAARGFQGPRGGPPTAAQNSSRDKDIGEQFEKCIFGRE